MLFRSVVDLRTVEETRAFAQQMLRRRCTASILAVAPEHAQRNAGLGILPVAEADAIRQAVQVRRQHYAEIAAQILSVSWDGREETRAECCDLIESFAWNEP